MEQNSIGMVIFLKAGRAVIMLQGRIAGKKAVIVQNSDTGNKERRDGHCAVASVEKYPCQITKRRSKKKSLFALSRSPSSTW